MHACIHSLQFDEYHPYTARPQPLYGNVVSVSPVTSEVTVMTYPSSKKQAQKQGKAPRCYVFSLHELPQSQASRTLWRAIQGWINEVDAERAARNIGEGSDGKAKKDDEEDPCGPRVTFLDLEEWLAFKGETLPPPVPPKPGQTQEIKVRHHHQHRRAARPQQQQSSYGEESSSLPMSQSSSTASSSLSAASATGTSTPPRRAVDVGLVWWTMDLHGKHL